MQQGVDLAIRKDEEFGSRMSALVARDAEAPPQRRREVSVARVHPGILDSMREMPARLGWPAMGPRIREELPAQVVNRCFLNYN